MHQIYSYDLYIFDCDGVILNSNQLKIDAMEKALKDLSIPLNEIEECVNYFASNFGKSRFHHVKHFINDILRIDVGEKAVVERDILALFSSQCTALYLKAELTPNFLQFINTLDGDKYVASGSEQAELRDVFNQRGLSQYFKEIYGSPIKKHILLEHILQKNRYDKALMIGDAISDFEASHINDISFLCYIPYSNVKDEMKKLAAIHQFSVIDTWPS